MIASTVNRQRLVLLISGLLLCSLVIGHPESVSYSQFSLTGDSVTATYRLPMDDMDLLLMLDEDIDGSISSSELQASTAAIRSYLQQHTDVLADNVHLPLQLEELGVWYDQDQFPYLEARVRYQGKDRISSLRLKVSLLKDLYPDHKTLGEFTSATSREQFVFQRGNTWETNPATEGGASMMLGFILLGIEHIVTGYDHLLFLLGLLLAGRGLRDLVTIVTAFTLGHSVTLGLAVFQAINPGAQLVESAIALSIVYVGAENVFARKVRLRWLIALLFGLVHGFGFAAILRDLVSSGETIGWSLFSFNLGVELGQVAIVAVTLPLILMLRKSAHHKLIVRLLSLTIVAFGLYWFIERIS